MMNLNYEAFKSISKLMDKVDSENDCATFYKKGRYEIFVAVTYCSLPTQEQENYISLKIVVNGLMSIHNLKTCEEVKKAKEHINYLKSLI